MLSVTLLAAAHRTHWLEGEICFLYEWSMGRDIMSSDRDVSPMNEILASCIALRPRKGTPSQFGFLE